MTLEEGSTWEFSKMSVVVFVGLIIIVLVLIRGALRTPIDESSFTPIPLKNILILLGIIMVFITAIMVSILKEEKTTL